ncbi:hypothetical protein K1719_014750 [Acacia pycnantha]|nr:hypothetical protein K1719_014750 [Acacia pycnantha]
MWVVDFGDPSTALSAACGGDIVKLFDSSVKSGDPCSLSYAPSPGFQVNSVKWNHTTCFPNGVGDSLPVSSIGFFLFPLCKSE